MHFNPHFCVEIWQLISVMVRVKGERIKIRVMCILKLSHTLRVLLQWVSVCTITFGSSSTFELKEDLRKPIEHNPADRPHFHTIVD